MREVTIYLPDDMEALLGDCADLWLHFRSDLRGVEAFKRWVDQAPYDVKLTAEGGELSVEVSSDGPVDVNIGVPKMRDENRDENDADDILGARLMQLRARSSRVRKD